MVITSDTSFLFSLYGNDSHTPNATAWLSAVTAPIYISIFNDFELRNALRFAEFARRLDSGAAASHLVIFESALSLGRIILRPIRPTEILAEASRLSAAHTLTGGHRGFDLLHVAAANLIGATHFLTFDANQKKLAAKEGFIVPF